MNYNYILQSRAVRHKGILSKRHLIRLLKKQGLQRKQYTDLREVIHFIMQQLEEGPGRLHGYRRMYKKCLKNVVHAKKEDVRWTLTPRSSVVPDD